MWDNLKMNELDQKEDSIHLAMHDAIFEVRNPSDGTYTMRLNDDVKLAAISIAERHGVTLAAFLRQCCERLVREYGSGQLEPSVESSSKQE